MKASLEIVLLFLYKYQIYIAKADMRTVITQLDESNLNLFVTKTFSFVFVV